jgi:hypothetical protein
VSSYTNVRGYPRLVAYLPVQCTSLCEGTSMAQVITGKTNSISPGGLGLLLPETIPLRTPVVVQVCEEEPLRGLVIWLDKPTPTPQGNSIPHGVGFDLHHNLIPGFRSSSMSSLPRRGRPGMARA